ncbi:MAG: carbamoyl-phosphate synthase large subunit, partial [Clostridia bacterium]|nr:carbamoyl-phosphate synthase large subunit [Clostridia bacterium]
MPRDKSIKKTLVIGSGPIVIGQAAEFDYAGTQACRVLEAEGVETVLVNSNPATVMTDTDSADEVYLEPLTPETVKRVIIKEKPDSLLAGLGGQTGLTLAMQLDEEGFLEEHGVRLIGSCVSAIKKSEDRQSFKETMEAIGEPVIPSDIACDVEKSLAIAEKIGYPVIVRPAYTLGGSGGGVANTPEELRAVAAAGVAASPIGQILVERYIYGWKEIEFETMRDGAGNVIAVCSMENVDPVGVHTGDSVVVAPALTLSDREYQMLRSASLNIITALGIVGGCNCQFALDPVSFDYAVIEVNPRVSRSSALASKATGYPIAKITTKIALGYTLDEIRNDITGKTCACFEPALDYVVVKLPKWPFDKLRGSSRTLGTQMKATGEVMAIGRNFCAALMKAVRGAEIGTDTLNYRFSGDGEEDFDKKLAVCDDRRLFTVFAALKAGVSVEKIAGITRIDPFFLSQIKRLADYELEIGGKPLDNETYMTGKRLGYTDRALEKLSGAPLPARAEQTYRIVDTCGGEFDSVTPYFYSSYDDECEARLAPRRKGKTVIVLGSGPIRIGQGIEFDYSSVHCARTLKKLGYDVVIINNNPETVSTDYDTADRLYFEPLTEEDVMGVVRVEDPVGVVVAFGGQTAIKLTKFLDSEGIKILGTSAEGIDTAEDRERFDELLGRLGVKRPRGFGVTGVDGALQAAHELGYPVLLRPSYVIGGQNMRIVYSDGEVREYMAPILEAGVDSPVLVDKYMSGIELEVDVISDGRDVLIPGIMEHIERAGVHSGDSIAVLPAFKLNDKTQSVVAKMAEDLALALGTRGLVNIQMLIYRGEPYVIEVNPRASRTVPYISKVTGVPMIELATRVMVGEDLRDLGYGTGLYRTPPYYAVKVPVFSFEKLPDAFSGLGPEMKSTGEVLGIGKDLNEALFKGMRSAGLLLPSSLGREGVGFFIHAGENDVHDVIDLSKKLHDLRFTLWATEETAEVISRLGIDVNVVGDVRADLPDLLKIGKISYVFYTSSADGESVG